MIGMSSISIDVPTLRINKTELQNLVGFIYKHERLLKKFGAIKIQPNIECQIALKKRTKTTTLRPTTEQIVKISNNELIDAVQNGTEKIRSLCSVRVNMADMIRAIVLNEVCYYKSFFALDK
jgi:hypothetical protein